ncbi:DUF4554 domain-containing protein isoform X1 [Mugil cephalus]|uniref:DUF4554 domain-containing protein isoform X1 n=1 Tax=Mugil cephalus TaxID=48193 RepID=UPI001FB5B351|nr:DUF4554 domain-containing protein isoform X1 [Mugil cephalus]
MLRDIQQVLRFIMLMGKQKQHGFKFAGGLLVLMWTEEGVSVKMLNCTVAAAGPWCAGIKTKALQHVLSDLKSMFPHACPCLEPDPEELSTFTDLHGPLALLLSFQMKDARHCTSEWKTLTEAYLRTFSLANAGVKIHLTCKFNQHISQQEFRVKLKRKVANTDQRPLILDVTCSTEPPLNVRKGRWCQGGHPVLGGRVPLSIPPQAMDQGLFGELSVQLVSLLRPCVLVYPNLATEVTHIQVLVYGPSNVPIAGSSGFFQTLPASLDCQELGLGRLHCSSFKVSTSPAGLVHSGCTVYTVEQGEWRGPEQESSPPTVQQSLLLFLFLQHSDPFVSELTDIMSTEVLIEHHLEDVLNNNRQAVTTALQTELKNTLSAQNQRKKHQEKLRSAVEVILSSSISVVCCSTNMDFRNACLNRMRVRDTNELFASLRKSLWKVTSWKFTPRSSCYYAQMEEHPERDDPPRSEI